ncbi:MAG: CpaD family pilus assembly protein [Variibacter sp.]
MTVQFGGSRADVLRATRKLLAVALLTATCGGCMFSARQEEPLTTASVPTDYRLRHPIVVRESERSFDVFVGTRRGSLTALQRSEIAAFVRSWREEGTGGFIIDLPSGTPNAHAAKIALREVRSVLSRAGVPARAIEVRPFTSNDPTRMATLRLNYPRMAAQAGPCGLWPDDLGPTADQKYSKNRPYWNLGCSTQHNLAAMVANPQDLAQPRSEGPVYSMRRTTIMEKYRRGDDPGTVYNNASKGNISDVGK